MAETTDRRDRRQHSPELMEEAWRSTSRRSRSGLLGYVLIFGVLGGAASLELQTPWVGAAALAILLLTALRAVLILRFDSLYPTSPQHWQAAFRASLVALVVLLAALIYLLLATRGLSLTSFLGLMVAGATMSVGVIVYSEDLVLTRIYVSLLGMPPVVALAQLSSPLGRASLFAILAVLAYMGYLFTLARHLHDERWDSLEKNLLLAARAAELEQARSALEAAHGDLERQVAERGRSDAGGEARGLPHEFRGNASNLGVRFGRAGNRIVPVR